MNVPQRSSEMRSSRRQRNLPPDSPATMESVECRSNKFALDARRPSRSPIALSAQPDHVPQDLSNQRSRACGSCATDSLLSLRPDFHRATAQANTATQSYAVFRVLPRGLSSS